MDELIDDVVVSYHGSICLVEPISDAAKDWIAENVDPNAQWFGNALVVEPRYVDDLVLGMIDNGCLNVR